MAVFTPLSEAEIREYLADYDIGELESFAGIAEGVSNTNYLLETSQAKFILTLFEKRTNIEELPYFTHLMQHLHARGVPCPLPIARKDGRVLSVLKDKAALVVSFLEGSSVRRVEVPHMLELGAAVAKMHIAGMDFPHRRANALSVKGWEGLIDGLNGRADEIESGLTKLISEEFNYLEENWPSELPSGAVHADLFPDNVFFGKRDGVGGGVRKKSTDTDTYTLTGIIDWYFACHESWAYDLAIAVNAWCFDDRHRFVPERTQMLMHAYNEVRSFTPEEDAAMPLLLRGAALRFLLTRSYDWVNHPGDDQVTRKDPLEYARKLEFFQKQA